MTTDSGGAPEIYRRGRWHALENALMSALTRAGVVPWVLNARAAGTVTLSRRGTSRQFTIREVPAHDAGDVLKRYVAIAGVTEKYVAANKSSPAQAFAAAAHPFFELRPVAARD